MNVAIAEKPVTIDDRLDEIAHCGLDLRDKDVDPCDGSTHRPELRIWAGNDEHIGPHVVLMLGTMWGCASRFVELTPDEARKFCRLLTDAADKIDAIKNEAA